MNYTSKIMENYEQKYKEALVIMSNLHKNNENSTLAKTIERAFPELKESEDERIRKGIIIYLEQSQFGEEHYQIDDDIVRNFISWLEKQKTSDEALRYLRDNHSPSEVSDFQEAMNIAVAKAFDAGRKQGEQKPVEWSNEDKKMRDLLINQLAALKCSFGLDFKDTITWLKSLKPQSHWKLMECGAEDRDKVKESVDLFYFPNKENQFAV